MRNIISHSELRRLLHYDPETGIWTRRIKIHPCQTPVGTPIRASHRHGYCHFSISGHKYLAHRLAWFYITGVWPIDKIDHIDGNPANNRWNNLRRATQQQNCWNSRISVRNKTGLKGVFWDKIRQNYCAQIRINGRRTHLGRFDCPAAAAFKYMIEADKRGGEFARVK